MFDKHSCQLTMHTIKNKPIYSMQLFTTHFFYLFLLITN